MFHSISHQPGRVRGSHSVRPVRKDQAVILSSLHPIFVLYNSARENPITSANPQHLALLPVLPGTLPLPPGGIGGRKGMVQMMADDAQRCMALMPASDALLPSAISRGFRNRSDWDSGRKTKYFSSYNLKHSTAINIDIHIIIRIQYHYIVVLICTMI